MRTEMLTVRTGGRPVVRDITGECAEFVAGEQDGLLHVFVPHATAGLALIETGAGSDDDLLAALDQLLPADGRWRHRHGSPGHGRDHVLPAFVPPYATLPVVGGRLQLAPGSRSAWSTPTATTPPARSGCRSWPVRPRRSRRRRRAWWVRRRRRWRRRGRARRRSTGGRG